MSGRLVGRYGPLPPMPAGLAGAGRGVFVTGPHHAVMVADVALPATVAPVSALPPPRRVPG